MPIGNDYCVSTVTHGCRINESDYFLNTSSSPTLQSSYDVQRNMHLACYLHVTWPQLKFFLMHLRDFKNVGRFANESFRQRSVRKRVGSIRKRPIVGSQTSYITRSVYCVQG